jgi:hypothetical protein
MGASKSFFRLLKKIPAIIFCSPFKTSHVLSQ